MLASVQYSWHDRAMTRRRFIQSGLAAGIKTSLGASLRREGINQGIDVLNHATRNGEVDAAVLHVVQRDTVFTRAFGKAQENSMFLLGSISKPICVTSLMTLFDRGEFQLGDRLQKFVPEFKGDRREEVTFQHLLTHTSGLPDQLA